MLECNNDFVLQKKFERLRMAISRFLSPVYPFGKDRINGMVDLFL
jgi:hypothetical protein